MSQIEDLLRQAYAEAAQTVTWADIASAVPAIEETRPSRRRRLSIASLAAAAIVAVAVAATTIPAVLSHHPPPAAGSGWPHRGLQAQPAFFAALPATGDAVQIRSALTGTLIAAISPPEKGEFFSGVAEAGANGRVLLLAVERDSGAPCKTWLFRVLLAATGQPTALQPAQIPSIPGILPNRAFTAASEGSAVAFADYCQGRSYLEIERLRPGTAASWSLNSGDQVDDISLDSNGATLSISGFEYDGSGPGAKPGTSSVRLKPVTAVLHASAANTKLDGQGIVLRKYSTSVLSPDGKTLYACTKQGRADVLRAYDVKTRTLRRNVATWSGGGCSFALDPAGQYALIATSGGSLARLDLSTGTLTTVSASGLPASAVLAW